MVAGNKPTSQSSQVLFAFQNNARHGASSSRCAKMSCIHDELLKMPMGYNTLMGDMGSSLAGGQKQRILLARALYRRPKILFLDEATAHVDSETEKRISANLRTLSVPKT
jgi:ATP-binding cassette subfamily B protein RaxB